MCQYCVGMRVAWEVVVYISFFLNLMSATDIQITLSMNRLPSSWNIGLGCEHSNKPPKWVTESFLEIVGKDFK